MPTLNELAAAVHPPGTLDASTSLFNGAMSAIVAGTATLREVITGIAAGEWATEVAAVRTAIATGQKDRAEYLKKRLPAFTASGLISTRSKKACDKRLITHTGWLQADFDAKENPGMVQADARAALQNDPHIGAVFVGPSGAGIKALLRIEPSRHAESALSATAYFEETHRLKMDPACKDIERLCFVSHDPEAWMRPDAATVLPVTVTDPQPSDPPAKRKTRGGPPNVTQPHTEMLQWKIDDVREVLSFLKDRPGYEQWVRIVSGVGSVLPFAEAVAVLKEWMPPEQAGEYEDKLNHPLTHITIASVIRLAQKNGFDAPAAARRRRWMGCIIIGDRKFSGVQGHSHLLRKDIEPEDIIDEVGMSWEGIKMEQFGDAKIFEEKCFRHWKYDEFTKKWRSYNEDTGLWEKDTVGEAMLTMREMTTEAYGEIIKVLENEHANLEETHGPAPKPKKGVTTPFTENENEMKRVTGRIRNLNQSRWSRGVMDFAERLRAIRCRATDFDKDRNILAVANGVVNFRDGTCSPFSPGLMLATGSPVPFIMGAQCPHFSAFLLSRMGGDREVVDYLWRLIGYSLTGFVDHDALFICYGSGSNGKTTLFEVLKMLLGTQLSLEMNIGVLLGSSDETSSSIDYQKANLEGKRLVVTSETKEGRPLNEAMVKQLLGGGSIQARRVYEMPYSFEPTHKIWMGTNHKPKIMGTDHGIWRRIHLIPWLHAIPVEEQLPRDEVLALYRSELAGILNCALAGYTDFLNRGSKLDPPKAVLEATEKYRAEEDIFGNFCSETLTESPQSTVKISDLLKHFQEWCNAAKSRCPFTVGAQMAAVLRQRGKEVQKHGMGGFLHLTGFRLSSDPVPKFSKQDDLDI